MSLGLRFPLHLHLFIIKFSASVVGTVKVIVHVSAPISVRYLYLCWTVSFYFAIILHNDVGVMKVVEDWKRWGVSRGIYRPDRCLLSIDSVKWDVSKVCMTIHLFIH